MKVLSSLIAVTFLGACSIASAQVKMPDPNAPGGSLYSAIRIVAPNDLMIDRMITRWVRTHYPGWDADPYEIQEMGPDRYAVVYIRAANQPGRRLYFRVQKNQNDQDNSPFPGM
jgi:hypothetical protein